MRIAIFEDPENFCAAISDFRRAWGDVPVPQAKLEEIQRGVYE